MKKYFILLLTLFSCMYAQAQNTVAKLKYEDAEKAFYNGDYQSCISLLDETEGLLSKSAPNILHLRIMAESKVWEADPYGSYEQLETLRKLCDQYLKNYDIPGLEEKYRQVYDLSAALPMVSNSEELKLLGQQVIAKEKAKKLEKIIAENNLVFVKGGTYMMGEGKNAHEVTVSDFYIGKYEVTYKDWNKYLRAKGKKEEEMNYGIKEDGAYWFYTHIYDSWKEAMAYCKWLEEQYGGIWRIPTEAEWEYAARGGNRSKGYKYSGSDDWKEVAGKYRKYAPYKPIGRSKPNELDIYDMTGNFYEVCYDYYRKNYYSFSPTDNPMGPEEGKHRVVRGGGSHIIPIHDRWNTSLVGIVSFRVVYISD